MKNLEEELQELYNRIDGVRLDIKRIFINRKKHNYSKNEIIIEYKKEKAFLKLYNLKNGGEAIDLLVKLDNELSELYFIIRDLKE